MKKIMLLLFVALAIIVGASVVSAADADEHGISDVYIDENGTYHGGIAITIHNYQPPNDADYHYLSNDCPFDNEYAHNKSVDSVNAHLISENCPYEEC